MPLKGLTVHYNNEESYKVLFKQAVRIARTTGKE